MDKILLNYLKEKKIVYELYRHDAVFTVEDSNKLEDIKKIPGLRTKNLFLKDNEGKFYLVCMQSGKRLDIKKLEKHLSVRKIKFSTAEELKNNLNSNPGSVSLFGIIYSKNIKLIIDQDILKADLVCFHPNINTSTIVLSKSDLKKFLENFEFEVIDIE